MRFHVGTVCLLFVCLTTAAPQSGPASTEIFAGLESPGSFSSRLMLDQAETRLVWTAIGDSHRPLYQAVGLASPWCAIGPLETGGLVRQFGSPLDYSVGSTVWLENPGLRLYAGRERTTRFGAFLQSGSFGAGGYVDGRAVPHGLALLNFGQGSGCRIGLVGLASRPPLEIPDEAWFSGDDSWPGGWVLHTGAETVLQTDSARLAVCAAASRPERLQPGGFLHGWLGFDLHRLASLDLFAGAGTPDYRAPDGSRITRCLRACMELKLRPVRQLELHLTGEGNRRRGQPGLSGLAPSEWKAGLGGTLTCGVVVTSLERYLGWQSEGMNVAVMGDQTWISWRLAADFPTAGQVRACSLTAGLYLDLERAGLDLDLDLETGPAPLIDFSLGLWMRLAGALFRIGAGLEDAVAPRADLVLRRLRCSLSWEWKSPADQARGR